MKIGILDSQLMMIFGSLGSTFALSNSNWNGNKENKPAFFKVVMTHVVVTGTGKHLLVGL